MIIIISVVVFIIDLISKVIVSNNLELYESISVIDNFFNITYTHNYGGAWSIFENSTLLITIISIIIIILLIFYVIKNKITRKTDVIGYSLIIGGALGNLFDRIVHGYVIDFLDFNIFGYDYPIFNIADTMIVIGIFILLIFTERSNKHDNN